MLCYVVVVVFDFVVLVMMIGMLYCGFEFVDFV